MTRELKIGGVDFAGFSQHPTWSITMSADQGQVGTGSLEIEDQAGILTVPSWKAVIINETATAGDRIFTGYTANLKYSRGALQKTATARVITADLLDVNTRLEEELLRGQGAVRDVETDNARIAWLATAAEMAFVDGTEIHGSTVSMDAADYRNTTALDVLRDCAEASGKNYFLTWTSTVGYVLFYSPTNFNALRDTVTRISPVIADQDGHTYYPSAGATREMDASQIYSGVNVNFDGGSVFATASGTASTYKTREINIQADSRTSDGAENVAAAFLDQSDSANDLISLSVTLDKTEADLFLAGYAYQLKLPWAGISSFTYYRLSLLSLTPVGPDKYRADMQFSPRVVTKRTVRARIHPPVLTDESIPNGSFEFGPQGSDNDINDWIVTAGTARTYNVPASPTSSLPRPHGGRRALRVDRHSAVTVWTEDFAPVAGFKNYLIKGYWMWADAYGPNAPTLKVRWYDANKDQTSTDFVAQWVNVSGNTGKWQRVAFVTRAPSNARYRKIYLASPDGTSNSPQYFNFFDDFTFEPTDYAVGATIPAD